MAEAQDDLVTLLLADATLVAAVEAAGLTLAAGTTLFSGPMPAQVPDADACAAVALVSYLAGRPSEPRFGLAGPFWEWPRIQVLVRGRRDALAEAEAVAALLYRRLGKVQAQTINATFYLAVTCLQPPTFLRWDGDHRPEVVFNVEAHREVP